MQYVIFCCVIWVLLHAIPSSWGAEEVSGALIGIPSILVFAKHSSLRKCTKSTVIFFIASLIVVGVVFALPRDGGPILFSFISPLIYIIAIGLVHYTGKRISKTQIADTENPVFEKHNAIYYVGIPFILLLSGGSLATSLVVDGFRAHLDLRAQIQGQFLIVLLVAIIGLTRGKKTLHSYLFSILLLLPAYFVMTSNSLFSYYFFYDYREWIVIVLSASLIAISIAWEVGYAMYYSEDIDKSSADKDVVEKVARKSWSRLPHKRQRKGKRDLKPLEKKQRQGNLSTDSTD